MHFINCLLFLRVSIAYAYDWKIDCTNECEFSDVLLESTGPRKLCLTTDVTSIYCGRYDCDEWLLIENEYYIGITYVSHHKYLFSILMYKNILTPCNIQVRASTSWETTNISKQIIPFFKDPLSIKYHQFNWLAYVLLIC